MNDLTESDVCEILIALNGWKNRLRRRNATGEDLERAVKVEVVIEKVKALIRTPTLG